MEHDWRSCLTGLWELKGAKAGWQPITLLLIETVWMALFVLAAIALTQSGWV